MNDEITLLIVDDEPTIRIGVSSLPWEKNGIKLLPPARNGIEAANMLQEYPVDILLTDIRMPGMSGLELGELALKNNPEVHVIFLTGYDEFSYAHQAIEMHASGYILKPASPDTILAQVNREKNAILASRQAEEENQRIASQLKSMKVLAGTGQASQTEAQAAEKTSIRQIIDYLTDHYQEQITLSSLAEQFHFNTVYLSRYIRSKSGYTFTEILTLIRMHHAARLLRTTRLKNGEICERVGMGDERYWGQVFKRHYGVTPNEYRKGAQTVEKDALEELLAQQSE